MAFALRLVGCVCIFWLGSSCASNGTTDDPCRENTQCQLENRICVAEGGTATCGECLEGYHVEDTNCVQNEQCTDDSCSGHGVCDDMVHPLACSCYSGYLGDKCDSCDTAGGYQDVGGGICQQCEDQDGDNRNALSVQCSSGTDWCDDDNANWSETGCSLCVDLDGDGYGPDCDASDDCDDNNDLIYSGCEVDYGFRIISRGTFAMGSPEAEIGRDSGETQHEVVLTRTFEIMETEVTQIDFQNLVTWNPSGHAACGDNCPVESVSWYDALHYANLLSQQHGLAACYQLAQIECADLTEAQNDPTACMNATAGGVAQAQVSVLDVTSVYDCRGYRLPTEAEWEFAARAGTRTSFYAGEIDDVSADAALDPLAWYANNSANSPQTKATREQNPWGLADMLGNVREWTWDGVQPYTSASVIDPEHLPDQANPDQRVVRNGAYLDPASDCRAARRSPEVAGTRAMWIGFRLVRSLFSD